MCRMIDLYLQRNVQTSFINYFISFSKKEVLFSDNCSRESQFLALMDMSGLITSYKTLQCILIVQNDIVFYIEEAFNPIN